MDISHKHITVAESTRQSVQHFDREGYCILDAGAGNRAQERPFTRANYVSLDITPDYGVSVVADIHFLPFKDCVFDVVMSTQVLEHIKDPFRGCREFYRVIKPGGQVYLTIPFVWKEHAKPTDFWRFTRDGCYHLLDQAGFENIRIVSNGGYFIVLDYVLRKVGYRLFSQYVGRIIELIYTPIGRLLHYLDKVMPHNDFSINFSIWATKGT